MEVKYDCKPTNYGNTSFKDNQFFNEIEKIDHMELQRVRFDQAKELKDLGFTQETDSWSYYDIEGKCTPHLQKGGHKEYCCDAPSLELVAKWFREEKKLFIFPYIYYDTHSDAFTVVIRKKFGEKFKESILLDEYDDVTFPDYESALSAGIDKAIEILKQTK